MSQTYLNKELIILYEEDDVLTRELIASKWIMQTQIISLEIEPESNKHLGQLRNLAIERAKGEYICQWDDDDWYHPERLSYQYNLLRSTTLPASVLGRIIIYDSNSGKAYLSCYRHWEGTILCKKETALKYPYSNLRRGEDTPVINALLQNKILHTDNTFQPFYIYRYHGGNTWDYQHFQGFFPFSVQLPDAITLMVKKLLNEPGIAVEYVRELVRLFYETYTNATRNS